MHINLFSSFSCLTLFFSCQTFDERGCGTEGSYRSLSCTAFGGLFICLQELVIRQFYSYILLINRYFSKMHIYLKCTYLNASKPFFSLWWKSAAEFNFNDLVVPGFRWKYLIVLHGTWVVLWHGCVYSPVFFPRLCKCIIFKSSFLYPNLKSGSVVELLTETLNPKWSLRIAVLHLKNLWKT